MHLERWMVDEIVDDDVRVLRAVLRDESPQVAALEAAFASEWSGMASEAQTVANRDLALGLEAAPLDGWTEEVDTQVDRRRLAIFLVGGAGRTARPGLPVREDIREGDVYYVVEPTGSGRRTQRAVRELAADQAPAALEVLEEAAVEVWDVTAAARQVMKRLYGDAAFARTDERSTPEGQAGG